jgi:hypothetical protein
MVEEPVEEGPEAEDVEGSAALVRRLSSFALPLESGVEFNGCGEDADDGMDGRDDPPGWGSSGLGWSGSVLGVGESLVLRRR